VGVPGKARLRVLRPELAVSSRLGDLRDLQGPRRVAASAAGVPPIAVALNGLPPRGKGAKSCRPARDGAFQEPKPSITVPATQYRQT
jgi:hypothetical protein